MLTRRFGQSFAELMERGWNMDDCLHEMTNLRHDLPSLLQPRPRVFKPLPAPSSQTASPRADGPKRQRPRKIQREAEFREIQGQRTQWVTEIQRDGGFKQLCMRYQVGKLSESQLQLSAFVCVPSGWKSLWQKPWGDVTLCHTSLTPRRGK